MLNRIPRPIRLYISNILLFFTFFFLLRILFLIVFSHFTTNVSWSEILDSLSIGYRFDLRLASLLTIPIILFSSYPLFVNLNSKVIRKKSLDSLGMSERAMKLVNIYQTMTLSLCMVVYFVDIFYYKYMDERLSVSIFRFNKVWKTSVEMAWQTYPIIRLSLVTALVAFAIWYLLRKVITPKYFSEKPTHQSKLNTTFQSVVFFFAFVLSIYGNLNWYPLRWSQAFFSTNQFISYSTLNPILYFMDSRKFGKSVYDPENAKKYFPLMVDYLGLEKDAKELDFRRVIPAKELENKPNIIIILMESLGAVKTSYFGNKIEPTPVVDELIKDSLFFENFYTPTISTARSVFTAFTTLADVSKVRTGTRNPFIINQNVLINQAKDYEKYYFLGGNANWGNVRGMLTYNIEGLHLFEEGMYDSPRSDVWGISDLNLFKEADARFAKIDKSQPFFGFVQTSGYHRPYTIPEDSGDFKTKDIEHSIVTKYGFESSDEYNSIRLQDYSLGEFMKMAKKSGYYDNTIFIIFGDHGLPDKEAVNVPKWQHGTSLPLSHVPLVIHGPKFFGPEVRKEVVSEVDIMPTVMGLIGQEYYTKTLGRDILDPQYDDRRMAFYHKFSAPFPLTLVDNEYFFEYKQLTGTKRLLRHDDFKSAQDISTSEPELLEKYFEKAKAFYESSQYMLHNNKRE